MFPLLAHSSARGSLANHGDVTEAWKPGRAVVASAVLTSNAQLFGGLQGGRVHHLWRVVSSENGQRNKNLFESTLEGLNQCPKIFSITQIENLTS